MADEKDRRQKINDMVSAYDERTRLFGNLRNQKLEGDALEQAITDYATASKNFDDTKTALLKK